MTQAENNSWRTWYETFDETHSPEARRQWYNQAAKAYRWARPTYPAALLDSVVTKAGLKAGASVLEIGCGPGIATEAFAERKFVMQSVDPSPMACELARQACKPFNNVTITNSTFEDFALGSQRFDAVLAATSFHWVSPAIACKKSAAALKPGGALILLWATPPQLSEATCQWLQPVYDRFDLSELGHRQHRTQAYYQHNFQVFAHTVADSGLFPLAAVDIQTHYSLYSIEKYLALLSTLSDYIALDESVRGALFEALEDCLKQWLVEKEHSDALSLTHWFAAQVTTLLDPTPTR